METNLIISDSSKMIWKKLESEFKIFGAGVTYVNVQGMESYFYTALSARDKDEFLQKVDQRLAKNQWKLKKITFYDREPVQFLFVGYDNKLNEVYIFEVSARTRREVIKLIAEELKIESYRDKDYRNWKRIFNEAGIYRHELGKVF